MIINHTPLNQPLRTDAPCRCFFRRVLLGMIVSFPALFELGAETVAPFGVPAQERGLALGFTPVSKEATANLPEGDGSIAIPGDPISDPQVDPLTPIDPMILGSELPADIPLESMDSEIQPLSDDSLASSDFGYQPWMPSGGSFTSGISRGLFSGFNNAPGSIPFGGNLLGGENKGFAYSAALNGTYDSNPSQGYGTPADAGKADFFTTYGGALAYRSTASTWTYAAQYSGAYNQYFDLTNLSGYNQNAAASLNYESGPVTAGITLGVNYGSGANRYYASVVDEISYIYAMNARYRISSKTSLMGNFSHSINDVSGGNGTSAIDLGVSALWHYSPLTEFGPGIRFTHRSGDRQTDRSTVGPTLAFNYKLSTKISLNSIIGMDFVNYDGAGSSDTSFFTSIGLDYRASSLWWLSLSLLRDSQASYSAANEFEETTALRLGYNRQIRQINWTLGIGWETRTSENPTLAPTQPDRDYLTLDTGLNMPIFAGEANANVFMRYSDHDSGAINSWDSFQLGFGINRSF